MKRYPLAIILTAATLSLASCSKEDVAQGGGQRELAVNVRMDDSEWTTRAGGSDGRTVSPAIALDDQLEIVAETMPASAAEAPVTRGVPVANASKLPSMGLAIYTNSAFTKNASATNNGGSWALAGNIALDLDKNSYSYYAFAPAASADAGITLASNGQTLTYVAPADVTLQPDLCWAAPVTNDKTGTPTFAMQHALTAVGLRVRADNVEIESVKLLQVNTSGTLNVTNGTWSSLGTLKDQTFPLLNTKPSTGDNTTDLSGASGYLMLPPQSISADTKKLVIKYRYTGETAWRTGTHTLNALNGGAAWTAGQKVIYTLQLKAKFALTLVRSSDAVLQTSGSYSLSYTTSSSASATIDPQVSCPDANGGWITGLTVNRSSKVITFGYASNPSSVARKTMFTVTSGFTVKTFELTQLAEFWITLSATNPGGDVPRPGRSYSITVTTPVGIPWVVSSTTNCSVSPSSGGSGTTSVTITVPSTTEERNVSAVFSTNLVSSVFLQKTATWSGKQINAPDGCASTPLPGGWYVFTENIKKSYFNAVSYCKSKGGRMATNAELGTMYNNKASGGTAYGTFFNELYISANEDYAKNMSNGANARYIASDAYYFRCVRTL